jgi:hypothetical protein
VSLKVQAKRLSNGLNSKNGGNSQALAKHLKPQGIEMLKEICEKANLKAIV